MSNSYFRFKQFTVWQEKCAMKVGTDGVLLGAWADVTNVESVLDVGSGTGLVALMVAQRCHATITGVEIDHDAVNQAKENVVKSPWKDRIYILESDYSSFEPLCQYDLIVSNPPYFQNSLKSPSVNRNTARHTDELSFEILIKKSASLLNSAGRFSIIIPTESEEIVKKLALENGLYLVKQTYIFTKPGIPSKRTLMTFAFQPTKCLVDDLVIEYSRHVYSEEFKELTKIYYLDK